jgi:hypothetical protein
MDTFCQIAEICLMGLISNEELACWRLHIDIVAMLQQATFSRVDLATLRATTQLWKSQMVKLYPNAPFDFPNFETGEHWAEQIAYLGAPLYQSTVLWEARHHATRQAASNTNYTMLERDVLVRVFPPPLPTTALN